ncbi:MAG: hypothetical protein KAG98_04890 [Lentisphaeria bacterium]|nr:hypothetical protein [Lentisphaeria bacterium]
MKKIYALFILCFFLTLAIWTNLNFHSDSQKLHQNNTNRQRSAIYVALGGFRGLATDVLSLYALQELKKEHYESIPTLANWVVKLQSGLSESITYWSSEMAWNISVLHKDYALRWYWVDQGIQLLANAMPDSIDPKLCLAMAEIYRLRIGEIIEPADAYFKLLLAKKVEASMGGWTMENLALAPTDTHGMNQVLGDSVTESMLKENNITLDSLFEIKRQNGPIPQLNLTTQENEVLSRYLYRRLLEKRLGIDVQVAATIDAIYGPLDWRLPESLAAYWSYVGIQVADQQGKSKYPCQRMFYRSLARIVSRGNVLSYRSGQVQTLPNFSPAQELMKLFPEMIESYPKSRKMTELNYHNFLKELMALGFIYGENELLVKAYSTLSHIEPAFVAHKSVEELAITILSGTGKSHDYRHVQTLISGLFMRMFDLIDKEKLDDAEFLELAARKIWINYQNNPNVDSYEKGKLPPLTNIKRLVYESRK